MNCALTCYEPAEQEDQHDQDAKAEQYGDDVEANAFGFARVLHEAGQFEEQVEQDEHDETGAERDAPGGELGVGRTVVSIGRADNETKEAGYACQEYFRDAYASNLFFFKRDRKHLLNLLCGSSCKSCDYLKHFPIRIN